MPAYSGCPGILASGHCINEGVHVCVCYADRVRVTRRNTIFALQFDQGGLALQKDQYANKTEKDQKVCCMCQTADALIYLLTYDAA